MQHKHYPEKLFAVSRRQLLETHDVVHRESLARHIKERCQIAASRATLVGLLAGVPLGIFMHWNWPRLFQWLLP